MRNLFSKKYSGGAYKIAFSVCIAVLCVITVITTNEHSPQKTASTDKPTKAVGYDVEEYTVPAETEVSDSSVDTDIYADENEESHDEYIISYSYPVSGEIVKQFSISAPLYSETMDDWRIHRGVDIACEHGREVVASEYGLVEEVSYDVNYGHYVSVKHKDIVCRYMSLDSEITLSVGDNVAKGQLIGYVSDSAISEICDEPHLHFEVLVNGEYVNPLDYIS